MTEEKEQMIKQAFDKAFNKSFSGYEIIIDGVNVAGCDYVLNNSLKGKHQCPNKTMPYAKETSCTSCKVNSTLHNFCKNNPNCYYKQLIRAEQERDELKKACEKCKLFDIEKTNRDLLERIDKLEQENKELSFAIEKCLENAGIECDDEERAIRSLSSVGSSLYAANIKIEELKQENEELKEVKEQLKRWNDENLKRQDDMQLWIDLAEEQRKNYRSALEEIREIAMGIMDDDIDEGSAYYDADQIINKINEVLNG